MWQLPALLIVLLLPRVFTFVELGLARLAWPWQIDFVEGINLNATIELANGHNIYRHSGPEGFISAPYPPIFYLINAPVSWITGPSFGFGRALSLLSTVAIAILIAYVIWKISSNWATGAMSGVLWLSLSPVIVWSAFYKQDLPALALELAGLAWVLTYRQHGRKAYIGTLFFVLAFYTKQSALSAAVATSLWLLMLDPRFGLRFALLLASLVLAPFLAGNLLLNGGLWEHLVSYHIFPYSDQRWLKFGNRLWAEYWPLIAGSVLALLGWLANFFVSDRAGTAGTANISDQSPSGTPPPASAQRPISRIILDALRHLHEPWTLVALYALFGWAATLTKLGYEGANYNHLMDGMLPSCIVVGLLLAYLGQHIESTHAWRRALGLVGSVLLGALLVTQVRLLTDPHFWYRGTWPSSENNERMRKLSNLLAVTPGDMYSEDIYLLLSNGRRVLYDDPSTFVPLARAGSWDDSEFNRRLAQRRYTWIVIQFETGRWTEAGRVAFLDNYALKYSDLLNIYEAKPLALSCDFAGPTADSDALSLEAYTFPTGTEQVGVKAGQILRTTLYWRVTRSLQYNYASYVHLVSESNQLIAGQDNPNTGASQPTTSWEPGATITDMNAIPIPDGLSSGRYRVVVGMYRLEGGNIVPLTASCKNGETYGDAVSLLWVEVK